MEILKYYVPTSTASLPHYLGKAIILPARYYENKPADLQDQYKGYLILSENKWAASSDCAIEIIVTTEEQASMRSLGNGSPFYLYNNGIPVSRIMAVHFKDRKQSETTQWNINSATAFLPDHLINVDSRSDYSDEKVFPGIISDPGLQVEDLTEKAKRFDILLGGLAFLRAAVKAPANFPKDYFAVLAHFNIKIKSELFKAVERKQAAYNDQLTLIFTNKKSDWSEIQPLIFEEVNIAKVEATARKAKVGVEKKYGLIELEKLSRFPNIYVLALLATYGSNKPKNLQDLISGVLVGGELSEEKAEEIALVFGLNTRYSGLRNAYNGKELPIKFKLQSQLDYYTIESIFQYTFYGQKESGSFDYIDMIVRQMPRSPEPRETPGFWILDTPVTTKKKKDLEEELFVQLRNSYPAFQEIFEKTIRKGLQNITSQLDEKDREIELLREQLNTKDHEPIFSVTSTSLQPQDDATSTDDLEQLDLKELKALAKSKKIPVKAYKDLKQTYQGFSTLIGLIRSQKTLL